MVGGEDPALSLKVDPMPYRDFPLMAAGLAAAERANAAMTAAGLAGDPDLGEFGFSAYGGAILIARDLDAPGVADRLASLAGLMPGCEPELALGVIWVGADWGC